MAVAFAVFGLYLVSQNTHSWCSQEKTRFDRRAVLYEQVRGTPAWAGSSGARLSGARGTRPPAFSTCPHAGRGDWSCVRSQGRPRSRPLRLQESHRFGESAACQTLVLRQTTFSLFPCRCSPACGYSSPPAGGAPAPGRAPCPSGPSSSDGDGCEPVRGGGGARRPRAC